MLHFYCSLFGHSRHTKLSAHHGRIFFILCMKEFQICKKFMKLYLLIAYIYLTMVLLKLFSSVCVALEKNVLRFMLFMQSPTLRRASINFTDRKIYLNIFGTLFLAHMWYFKIYVEGSWIMIWVTKVLSNRIEAIFKTFCMRKHIKNKSSTTGSFFR